MAVLTKTNRINLRLTDSDKELLEMAANYNKQSLSAYIFNIVMKQAQIDIRNKEIIILENKERDLFLSLMDNPPEPNQRLKDLFKWLK